MEDFEELLQIGQRLESLSAERDAANFKLPVEAVANAAESVGRSFSGSWLGYHSRVYYDGFTPPPPGEHFSQEWGFQNECLGIGTEGNWREFPIEEVKAYILQKAGNPDLTVAKRISDDTRRVFLDIFSTIGSIISSFLSNNNDIFLSKLLEELNDVNLVSTRDVFEALRPKGQIMTRDAIARGQRSQVPPHIELLAEAVALKSPFTASHQAGMIATKAGSHMERQAKKRMTASRIGTNVFIGHGRSIMWRDLKDFISERLKLPYDEFNRVPVAGMTNIARLSEMLDSAAVAFLVMTAEDETAEGKSQARMNVIHEVGLFQGRLGFSRAIVLLEDGCEEFSNIQGLGQIRFPKGNIKAKFEDIRYYLEREGIIVS